ncbi:hypothetical protein PTMSG1_01239 [Pyrenophora teres f. maculata]|nr:hypothetical protein PTMSG1_01239 [Pyrenophora teres f. maculata]
MIPGEGGSSATISCTQSPEPTRSCSDRNRKIDHTDYDHISQENQLLSPLLSLPAELREIIYIHATEKVVMIYPAGAVGHKGEISALLWVCRQTRADTATQFFSKTKFELETLDKLAAFAQSLEKNYLKEIRTISLLSHTWGELIDSIHEAREYQPSSALPVPTKLSVFPALEQVFIGHAWRRFQSNFGYYRQQKTTMRIAGAMTNNDIITALNQANSPFFRLPPEIRNRVYQFALKEDETVTLFPPCGYRKKLEALAILSTCRQIYQETSKLYFSVNDFNLYYGWPAGYRRFAPQLGAIKTLCMEAPSDNLFDYRNGATHYRNLHRAIVSLFTALETICILGLPITNNQANVIYTAFTLILGRRLKYSS